MYALYVLYVMYVMYVCLLNTDDINYTIKTLSLCMYVQYLWNGIDDRFYILYVYKQR